MRPAIACCFAALLSIIGPESQLRAADFTLSESSFGIGVVGPFPIFVIDGFTDVAIPFAESHAVVYELSSAAASYQLDSTRFLINAMIASEAGGSTSRNSSATGMFHITTDRDLLVQYAGRFDYDLPSDPMRATARFSVDAVDDHEIDLVSVGHIHNTLFGTGPRSFEFSGEFVVPAERTWEFEYGFSIAALQASTGNVGTGFGFIELRFLPEPTTALLLALPAVTLIRQGRRRKI